MPTAAAKYVPTGERIKCSDGRVRSLYAARDSQGQMTKSARRYVRVIDANATSAAGGARRYKYEAASKHACKRLQQQRGGRREAGPLVAAAQRLCDSDGNGVNMDACWRAFVAAALAALRVLLGNTDGLFTFVMGNYELHSGQMKYLRIAEYAEFIEQDASNPFPEYKNAQYLQPAFAVRAALLQPLKEPGYSPQSADHIGDGYTALLDAVLRALRVRSAVDYPTLHSVLQHGLENHRWSSFAGPVTDAWRKNWEHVRATGALPRVDRPELLMHGAALGAVDAAVRAFITEENRKIGAGAERRVVASFRR